MEEIRNNGTTILFVSHAIEQIKRFCDKAIWLMDGSIKMIGDEAIVSDRYLDNLHLNDYKSEQKEDMQFTPVNSRLAKIVEYELNHETFKTFDTIELNIKYELFEDIPDVLIGVAIFDNAKNYIFGPNTHLDNYQIANTKGKHDIKYVLPNISLLAGTYFMHIGLFTDKGIVNLDFVTDAVTFTIESDYFTEGKVYLEHEWR